jgi:hypothetical protein
MTDRVHDTLFAPVVERVEPIDWDPRVGAWVTFLHDYWNFKAGDVVTIESICYGKCSHRANEGIFLAFHNANHVAAHHVRPAR